MGIPTENICTWVPLHSLLAVIFTRLLFNLLVFRFTGVVWLPPALWPSPLPALSQSFSFSVNSLGHVMVIVAALVSSSQHVTVSLLSFKLFVAPLCLTGL